ncbi:unnamed protein product, partial [Prunus brigantina]
FFFFFFLSPKVVQLCSLRHPLYFLVIKHSSILTNNYTHKYIWH